MIDRIIGGALRGALNEVLGPAVSQEAVRQIEERVREAPEVQQIVQATAPIPWYQSPVLVAQIVALVAPLLSWLLGVTLTDQDIAQLGQAIVGGVSAVLLIWGIFARVFSRAQPVTRSRPK